MDKAWVSAANRLRREFSVRELLKYSSSTVGRVDTERFVGDIHGYSVRSDLVVLQVEGHGEMRIKEPVDLALLFELVGEDSLAGLVKMELKCVSMEDSDVLQLPSPLFTEGYHKIIGCV